MRRDIAAERAEIDRLVAGKTLLGAFAETVERQPGTEALRGRNPDGTWRALTWGEYREQVRDAAMGLRALGFRPGSFGVILERNRPEHAIADLALLHARGTPVSLYNTIAPEQIAYVAGHCEATIAIVEDEVFLEKFRAIRDRLPSLEGAVLLEGDASEDWVIGWDEMLESGRAAAVREPRAFDEMWRQVAPEDLVTLVYTSGTTGPPKGVMNRHTNVLWTLESYRRLVEIGPGDRLVSYLPMAHAADRFLSHWQNIVRGATVWCCPDLTQLMACVLECRPTHWGAVPRVWEKLHAGIGAALGAEPDEARRAAVERAIDAGRRVVALEQRGEQVPPDLAAALAAAEPVFSAIRAKVGLDQARVNLTGAAPISAEVMEFFAAIGIPITEVWGMSELTAIATMVPRERIKIGSIGPTLSGVEARIEPDGELSIRGGCLMAGYYRDPEQTAETIPGDGWLRTGDVAKVDEDDYYTIVDRKKELIITAGGKNISPANLESLLKEHPLVGQACVIGDRRAYLTALVVLDSEVAPAWARSRGISAGSIAELAQHPDVNAEIGRAVAATNERVARVEQIKRFEVLPAEWTAESEELTPTLKLKRRVITAKYADVIENMYSGVF